MTRESDSTIEARKLDSPDCGAKVVYRYGKAVHVKYTDWIEVTEMDPELTKLQTAHLVPDPKPRFNHGIIN